MKNMNIYLVTHDKRYWDYNLGHVVFAKNPTNARKLCADRHADEGRRVWLEGSECEKIGESKTEKDESIILTDFNAG